VQPIVTPDEMAAIDAAAADAVEVLIGRAGAAVARAALRLLGGAYGRRVVVVAGKGNNGADGRAAARFLEARGVRCTVVDAAAPPPALPPAHLVIDAAYGTGFRGSYAFPTLTPAPGTSHAPPVLAVDIPSGISGLTGEASGTPATAAATVTFAALKPGLLLADGPDAAGTVELADIGLDVSSARASLVEPADVASWLPEPPRGTHKWRSAVWLVAGSPGMTGAAHLATAAAMRSGAGYARLSSPGADVDPQAPTEAVQVPLPQKGWAPAVLADLRRFAALAVGPGLGTHEDTAAEVRALIGRSGLPTVVDGDGLRALGPQAAEVCGTRPDGGAGVVLTPHDGEFAALAGDAPGPDRFAAARDLAARTGATVLLKGPTTLVARPDGWVWAAIDGDARLATAGSGDVLTGILAGLLAQGLPPDRATAAAACVHGRAGVLAWRRGLVAHDLVDHLPATFAAIAGG
jgi:NAD(P)H-hydrate epimerase